MDDSDIIFLKNVITFGTKVKEFINTEDENNKILVFKYKSVLEEDDLVLFKLVFFLLVSLYIHGFTVCGFSVYGFSVCGFSVIGSGVSKRSYS